jgi:subtilisin
MTKTILTAITIAFLSSILLIPAGNFSYSQPEMVDVIIGFHDKPNKNLVNGVGGQVHRQFSIISAVDATIPINAIAKLQNNPNVSFVEKIIEYQLHEQTTPWGVDRIDSEEAWAVTPSVNGSGVIVAVLDTGLDMDHPDVSAIWGYSVVSNDSSNFDDKNGHGTHTSGTIAAQDNSVGVIGVAPDVDLYSIQISKGSRISTANIVAGIDAAVAGPDGNLNTSGDQPDVFNMSFGGGYSEAVEDALNIAHSKGIVLVASAGNSSTSSKSYPAGLFNVTAVGSTTNTDALSGFSNYGSHIDVVAPGSSILSTYKGGGYATLSGTSMAGPHVAGVAALAIQANPTMTNDQIRYLLNSTATDLGTPGPDSTFGSGLVDAEKAVLGTTLGDNYLSSGSGGGDDPVNETTDAEGSPVPNTSVQIILERNESPVSQPSPRDTDDSGSAKWTFIRVSEGSYTTDVTHVGGVSWSDVNTTDRGYTR